MTKCDVLWYSINIFVLFCNVNAIMAQEENACYGPGSIAATVILTLIIGAIVAATFYSVWKKYWAARKGKHLILESDPEKGKGEFAFDNPGFKDAGYTPANKILESGNKMNKWSPWSPLGTVSTKHEKKQIEDDLGIENQLKVVSLRSHDFTGLGFNIYGNMKEGIFIKDILNRGPACESRKLNAGDRIICIAISFEHMVYEDALTILSYASPYEVTISARNGKNVTFTGQAGSPGHPIYRSSSSVELTEIGKSAKKCLFQPDEVSEIGSNYSSLQKTRNTATTFERNRDPTKGKTSQQLKTQLEEKIIDGQKENMRTKTEFCPKISDSENSKTENRHQKFGIKVFPSMESIQQKSPTLAELSQNENNLNFELTESIIHVTPIDDVAMKVAPPVKKREKISKLTEPQELQQEPFQRQNSLNTSGIKRDSNNIPLEIPNNMYNAALAARKNRKSVEEDEFKSPKKSKGKAPAPPELKLEEETRSEVENRELIKEISNSLNTDYDSIGIKSDVPNIQFKDDVKDYNSDSDIETDNQSSVNTIELNPNDITIHQSEENEEKQNRKTASTGDLTNIHKTRKNSSGTLERAQSLDITDTSIPTLTKNRKCGNIEDMNSKTSSEESLCGNVLLNKEPRLSLILDGLNTFQRSRLKKSSEWGNLEDAILNIDKLGDSSESLDVKISSYEDFKISSETLTKTFQFGEKSPEFDALVNKINEIKQETIEIINEQDRNISKIESEISSDEMTEMIDVPKSMQIMSKTIEEMPKSFETTTTEISEKIATVNHIKNKIWPFVHKYVKKSDVENVCNFDKSNGLKIFEEKKNIGDQYQHNYNTLDEMNDLDIEKKVSDGVSTQSEDINKTICVVNKNDAIDENTLVIRPFVINKENDNTVKKNPENIEFQSKICEVDIKPLIQIVEMDRDINRKFFELEESEKKNQIQSNAIEVNRNVREISTKISSNESYEKIDVMKVNDSRNVLTDTPFNLPTKPDILHKPDSSNKITKDLQIIFKGINKFIQAERESSNKDNTESSIKIKDTNESDDIKVSKNSTGNLECSKYTQNRTMHNISNVTVMDPIKSIYQLSMNKNDNERSKNADNITVTTPDVFKNITITEIPQELNNEVTVEGPTSLTFEITGNGKIGEVSEFNNYSGIQTNTNGDINILEVMAESDKNNSSLSYITEIQVITPNKNSNVSEIEIKPEMKTIEKSDSKDLDQDFEKYIKTFESNIKNFEHNINNFEHNIQEATQIAKKEIPTLINRSISFTDKVDHEKELLKVQEIVEEQLKKLPEMRFTTSSYESQLKHPEKRQSQIEILRSNFEKNTGPPRMTRSETSPPKSRIPVLNKTPPTSPERRDSKNLETEPDKAILEIMSSHLPMTSSLKYPQKITNRNVTVTSIRSNSKIPSGLPTYGSRPPVPPRRNECDDNFSQVSANGSSDSFKQWVFNPTESTVTSIAVTDTKVDHLM